MPPLPKPRPTCRQTLVRLAVHPHPHSFVLGILPGDEVVSLRPDIAKELRLMCAEGAFGEAAKLWAKPKLRPRGIGRRQREALLELGIEPAESVAPAAPRRCALLERCEHWLERAGAP